MRAREKQAAAARHESPIKIPKELTFGRDAQEVGLQFKSYLAGKNPDFGVEMQFLRAGRLGLSLERYTEILEQKQDKVLDLCRELLTNRRITRKQGKALSLKIRDATLDYFDHAGIPAKIVQPRQSAIKILPGTESHLNFYAQWAKGGRGSVAFDPHKLFASKGAAAMYVTSEKRIYIGLEDVLNPHELSGTRLHEFIHRKEHYNRIAHKVEAYHGFAATGERGKIVQEGKQSRFGYQNGFWFEELNVRIAEVQHSFRAVRRGIKQGADLAQPLEQLAFDIADAYDFYRVNGATALKALKALRCGANMVKGERGRPSAYEDHYGVWGTATFRSETKSVVDLTLLLPHHRKASELSPEHIERSLENLFEATFSAGKQIQQYYTLYSMLQHKYAKAHSAQIVTLFTQRSFDRVRNNLLTLEGGDAMYSEALHNSRKRLELLMEPFTARNCIVRKVRNSSDIEYRHPKTGRGVRVDEAGHFVSFVKRR